MTKEQLRAYRDIKLEKDKLAAMVEEVEAVLYSPRSPNLSGMPSGGSTPGSLVEEAAIKHAELLERYQRKVAEWISSLVEIENAIERLEDPKERAVLRLYYAQGLTWEEVCVAVNYSWRQTHRIHARALKALRTEKATG